MLHKKILTFFYAIKNDKNLFQGLVFIASCVVLITILFSILNYLPLVLKSWMQSITAEGSVFLANLLGLNARLVPESELWLFGNFLSINGYIVQVVFGCVGLNYLIIFVSGVATYPSPIKERVLGIILGVPLILLLNLIRIIFLGWIGSSYPNHVDFVHQVLWEWAFFFAIISLWWCWISYGPLFIKGCSSEYKKHLFSTFQRVWLRGVLLIVLVAVMFLSHSFITNWYMKLLALVSGLLMKVVGIEAVVSGSVNGVTVSNWTTTVPSVMEIILFLGITICFSKLENKKVFMKGLSVGLSAIIFIHVFVIFITYFNVEGVISYSGLTSAMNLVLPLSPFFIWLFLNVSAIIGDRLAEDLDLNNSVNISINK